MVTPARLDIDALARNPDAPVFVVHPLEATEARLIFEGYPVIESDDVLIGKRDDVIRGRRAYIWAPNGDLGDLEARWPFNLRRIGEILCGAAAETWLIDPERSITSFGKDHGEPQYASALAWARTHRSQYVAPPPEPIVEPEPSQEVPEGEETDEVDEDALAKGFSRRNPTWRYVAVWGKWLKWDAVRWLQDDKMAAFDRSRRTCREMAPYAPTVNLQRKVKAAATCAAVLRLAGSDPRHAASVDQWDRNLWALNTPGGTVNLTNGSTRPATMEDYVTKMTSVAPKGECPQWLEFLQQICDFDDELVAFLQRMIGYSLTGSTQEQCLFFLYGTGANGKGTFVNTIREIMADYAMVAGMDVFTESKHDRHPQELARLRGARMVCAQETDQGRLWAEARVKALTGGDTITAHFMRQDDFEFIPQFKLIIAGNHKPLLRNIDEAMRRRLHLVPFTVTIPPDKRDQDLGAKLRAEAAGILNWAITGCLNWQEQGLAPPEAVRSATAEYLDSQDVFGEWVLERTEHAEGSEKTRTSEMYADYRKWSEDRNEHPYTQKRFKEMLESRSYKISKVNGIPFVWYVRLKDAQRVAM
jgi:putative DNA primase/helicase